MEEALPQMPFLDPTIGRGIGLCRKCFEFWQGNAVSFA